MSAPWRRTALQQTSKRRRSGWAAPRRAAVSAMPTTTHHASLYSVSAAALTLALIETYSVCSHTRLADCLQTAASVPTVDQTASAFPDADADDRYLLFRGKDEGGGRGR